VQWLTFEVANLLLIENHLLLFILSCLFAVLFPRPYGLTGASIFMALLLLLMFLDDNLSLQLYNICCLMVLGAALGTFIKQKKWWFSAVSFVLSILVLWNAHRNYRTIEFVNVAPQQKTDISRFNELSKTFVSQNGDSLHLSLDTVYLVNFTFYACKPCREKHPSLKLLQQAFANQPFKLITLHCVDSIDIFQKHYRNIDNCYHNPNQKNSLKLGVSSYPYEIIFGKNGQEIRRHSGFSIDAKEDYQAKTKSLIEKLVGKK
jgi:thiol-disulfide isomerase/thioredoxin